MYMKTDNRYEKLGCPNCSLNKSHQANTYGAYIVYFNGTILKLKCKSCGYVQKFRFIRGGI